MSENTTIPEAATDYNFGLSPADLAVLLTNSLKPEEINGSEKDKLLRVEELVNWFVRYQQGTANPRWLVGHAMELAFYVATMDVKRQFNIRDMVRDAYAQGVAMSEKDRSIHSEFFVTKVDDTDLTNRLRALELQVQQLVQLLTLPNGEQG